ncbi:DUF5681 domain-containing protein [Cypionkella sp.]|uniref:DUF5681 domain-containing protein n=1 Tax=Cypionkella sp. TaxID=2811411 RepID=UPI002ABA0108|nr:DUF5681 domain-containing protein [Cypionkella sp.]MDZ4392468.1 DUF5681 domain-containing protein [Cypionkella sp.]
MNDFDDMVYRAGQATVQVRREGKPSEITMVEAIVRKQHEAGLKGSVVAQKDALQAFYRASEHMAAEAGLRLERWAKIKQSHAARIAEAQAKGEAIDDILPHPDDILLGGPEGVRIVGPVDLADAQICRKQVRLRNLLYQQQLLDDALNGITAADGPSSGAALVLGVWLNDQLPPSLQDGKHAAIARWISYLAMTKRELLKACHRGYQSLGMDVRRGRSFPSLAPAIAYVDIAMGLATGIVAAQGDRADEAEA